MAKITYIDGSSEIIDSITWDYLKNLNEPYYEIIENFSTRTILPECFNEGVSYNDFKIATIPYPGIPEERKNIIIIEISLEEYRNL